MIRNPNYKTVREISEIGIHSEYMLRKMIEEDRIEAIYNGRKPLIRLDAYCELVGLPVPGSSDGQQAS